MRRTSLLLLAFVGVALTAQGARGGGAGTVVDGTVNTHGNPPGTVDPNITATGGQNGTVGNPLDPIAPYVYDPPKVVGVPSQPMATTISGGGPGTERVYTYTGTVLNQPTIVVNGGGTVIIHITGNLTLNGGALQVQGGTRVVIFVDGATTFEYTKVDQLGTGNTFQIQGKGNVTIKAEAIQGVAFANKTLTLDTAGTAMSNLKMDPTRLNAPQEGALFLRVLPIVDGDGQIKDQ